MAGIRARSSESFVEKNPNPRQCGPFLPDSFGEDVEEEQAELVVVLDWFGTASNDGIEHGELGGHGGSC